VVGLCRRGATLALVLTSGAAAKHGVTITTTHGFISTMGGSADFFATVFGFGTVNGQNAAGAGTNLGTSGVRGRFTGSGEGSGVYGETNSTSGYGVSGLVTSATPIATSAGVFGKANSTSFLGRGSGAASTTGAASPFSDPL
jgi:hypothetical protein